jgi:hypothetical protein
MIYGLGQEVKPVSTDIQSVDPQAREMVNYWIRHGKDDAVYELLVLTHTMNEMFGNRGLPKKLLKVVSRGTEALSPIINAAGAIAPQWIVKSFDDLTKIQSDLEKSWMSYRKDFKSTVSLERYLIDKAREMGKGINLSPGYPIYPNVDSMTLDPSSSDRWNVNVGQLSDAQLLHLLKISAGKVKSYVDDYESATGVRGLGITFLAILGHALLLIGIMLAFSLWMKYVEPNLQEAWPEIEGWTQDHQAMAKKLAETLNISIESAHAMIAEALRSINEIKEEAQKFAEEAKGSAKREKALMFMAVGSLAVALYFINKGK